MSHVASNAQMGRSSTHTRGAHGASRPHPHRQPWGAVVLLSVVLDGSHTKHRRHLHGDRHTTPRVRPPEVGPTAALRQACPCAARSGPRSPTGGQCRGRGVVRSRSSGEQGKEGREGQVRRNIWSEKERETERDKHIQWKNVKARNTYGETNIKR